MTADKKRPWGDVAAAAVALLRAGMLTPAQHAAVAERLGLPPHPKEEKAK